VLDSVAGAESLAAPHFVQKLPSTTAPQAHVQVLDSVAGATAALDSTGATGVGSETISTADLASVDSTTSTPSDPERFLLVFLKIPRKTNAAIKNIAHIINSGGRTQPVKKKNPAAPKHAINAILKPFIFNPLKIIFASCKIYKSS
jgi:hypothetical protein